GGCAPRSGTAGGKLAVWTLSGAKLQGSVSAFEKANPGVTVELTEYPSETLHSKIVTTLATGGGPDLAVVPDQDLGDFAARGGLEPLDDFKADQNVDDD